MLNELAFRLPNVSQIFNAAATLPYVQPNAASFFREQACACPTTRKARLVRTRRKKDAAFGKFGAAKLARRGHLSFARTCIRYLRERILYSVNTNTRRQAKLIVVLLTWLGNAVGVFNECKSSRADSECRFSFFGEAKKSKCPAGMKRMVKTIVAPIKSYTRRRAADSTSSTARRANAV